MRRSLKVLRELSSRSNFRSGAELHQNVIAEVVKRMAARVGPGQPLVQLHPSTLTTRFRDQRRRAGLPKSITFYSLRDTFVS
jgi:hypothetical protein